MANEDAVDRAWAIMDKIGICMLTSRDGAILRSRPMAAYLARDEGKIYFLTDAASHKDDEIARDPHVCLAFADTSGQTYLSLSGTARVRSDREKVRQLWSTPAKAWWDNPDDPSIRVLEIQPGDAQYWDSPGTVTSYAKMIAAAIGGGKPDMGDNEKLRL